MLLFFKWSNKWESYGNHHVNLWTKNACPSLLNYLPKLLPSSSLHCVGTVRTCNHLYSYEKSLLNILILFFQ